jgi:hypothetical protein
MTTIELGSRWRPKGKRQKSELVEVVALTEGGVRYKNLHSARSRGKHDQGNRLAISVFLARWEPIK